MSISSRLGDLKTELVAAIEKVVDERLKRRAITGMTLSAQKLQRERGLEQTIEEFQPWLAKLVDKLGENPPRGWAAVEPEPTPVTKSVRLYEQEVLLKVRFAPDYTTLPSDWDWSIRLEDSLQAHLGEQAEVLHQSTPVLVSKP